MNTYDVIVNSEVVESIEQGGRSTMAMCYILMDRVYEWTHKAKSYVEVYNRRTGGLYRYV
ncbi:hypothetical protein SAMN04487895_101666 [Paenibacillus sophorae]|uniref:Uncharacterized protein n=1 Tax=Paenibacillus sophorae TaxID=1333845 RepID=A0A1H8GVS0_9BACL|nr:hypothetical protein SAMN04487895_101666 [Paenibacillus sophorae]